MKYVWDLTNKKTYNNRVGHYKFKQQFRFVARYADNIKSYLDIAGGSGRFAIPLHQQIPEITVLDINEEALSILKERDRFIEIICDDFMDVPFCQTYPLIICIEALFYFQNWDIFFSKINSLLSDKGRFVFSFTNIGSWRYLLRRFRHRNREPLAYTEKSLKELKVILSSCGLEIDCVEGMNWMPLPLSSNSIFVYVFEFIEKHLKLNSWISQSPWLMISVKKK